MRYVHLKEQIKLCSNAVEVGYISYLEKDGILELNELYVYPGYRQNGYGKNLCDEFIKLSQEKSCQIINNCWFFNELYA